jgi:YD repeat-containing protein
MHENGERSTTSNMTPAGTTQYVYDLAGHLIAEADSSGNTLTEYVWLNDMPLAAACMRSTSCGSTEIMSEEWWYA